MIAPSHGPAWATRPRRAVGRQDEMWLPAPGASMTQEKK
jgi:hypothetical protein